MTQCEMVLNHLLSEGSITPKEAEKRYGIMRLGARIYDLRKHGYTITTKPETKKNRFGVLTTYARYYYGKEPTNDQRTESKEGRA